MPKRPRLFFVLFLLAGLAMAWSASGPLGSPVRAAEEQDQTVGKEADDPDPADLQGEPDEETDEKDAEEELTYICPTCGFTSDEAGNCPACKIPLVEVASASGAQVSTKNGLTATAGDNQATIDASGNIKARSGGSSAGVSTDGAVRADDGKGNAVEVDGGKGVRVKSGNLELNIPIPGGN
ncbi:MAG: hypothetical protein OZSIB_2144 [Candidatus Ozemobacter sibiricus]|jgi:hypothetical protein|uniref:Uncharacterized protein n=1 Tax=Candidatus Ozemobacter sibiricus TaxID=2268124 RepID=A0A367ZT05_9BACT|nr:MAG: hypothetical protein OZSIB_2144 [Candidatus Ozemobacter sibiricus]